MDALAPVPEELPAIAQRYRERIAEVLPKHGQDVTALEAAGVFIALHLIAFDVGLVLAAAGVDSRELRRSIRNDWERQRAAIAKAKREKEGRSS